MSELDDLAMAAEAAAKTSGRLEDLERAASIYKLTSEAAKSRAEAATLSKSLSNEGLKNLAQLLVPLLSILTLGVTLWSQANQQNAQVKQLQQAEQTSSPSAWK